VAEKAIDLATEAAEANLTGSPVVFRLNGVDMAALVTKDHGAGVVSLTVFPCGEPQLVRNHVTRARLPMQENTWRPL
jgi:hypothetical protein